MIPTTIEDDIANGDSEGIGHRKLNGVLNLQYTNSDSSIKVPINPLVSKYKDFLEAYIYTVPLDEDEVREYRFAPKRFCLDVYGTTAYWSVILFINDCHSVLDFELTEIKYIDPGMIESLFEEILALEE